MIGEPESATGEAAFRARAGALTLLYLVAPMKRRLLLALLAEAATGAAILEEEDVPDPDDPLPLDIILDPYLVEPADPDVDPDSIDEHTMLKPSAAGRDLLFVSVVLERWLGECPDGPLELGQDSGPPILALLNGWASTVTHALAARPLTIGEIAEEVAVLDREAVEDRVGEMLSTGLVDVIEEEGEEERFAATKWLRTGIAPLAAAARQELRHPLEDTAPIAALDVQAAFLFSLPMLELREDVSGTCMMTVDLEEGVAGSPTGVMVQIERGQVISCEVRLEPDVDAWAAGSAAAWLDTVIEPETTAVRSGGDRGFARTVLFALHEALFGSQ